MITSQDPDSSSWWQALARYTAWPMVLTASMIAVREAILDGWSEVVVMGCVGLTTLLLCRGLEALLPFDRRCRDRKGDRLDFLNVLMTEGLAQGLFRGAVFLGSVLLGGTDGDDEPGPLRRRCVLQLPRR